MNSQPTVSILLPVYNCGKCIFNAVDSVIAQTYNNWKLFIIDDGSTSNSTKDFLKKIESELTDNLVVIRLEKNRGIVNALNSGLEYVNSKYVARIDCDDLW
jgi:glycosyltransferase involved in cell wall biosynthesis